MPGLPACHALASRATRRVEAPVKFELVINLNPPRRAARRVNPDPCYFNAVRGQGPRPPRGNARKGRAGLAWSKVSAKEVDKHLEAEPGDRNSVAQPRWQGTAGGFVTPAPPCWRRLANPSRTKGLESQTLRLQQQRFGLPSSPARSRVLALCHCWIAPRP
jgi:hypothetical protein